MPARRSPRRLGRAFAAIVYWAALTITLAACSSPTPSAAPSAAPATSLTIRYLADPEASREAVTWTLTCEPTGGDHPDPAGACAALEANGEQQLPPVPKDQACTMIYGGPNTATVTGTWNGQPVDATFNRSGGCEIDRWDSLQPLLPAIPG